MMQAAPGARHRPLRRQGRGLLIIRRIRHGQVQSKPENSLDRSARDNTGSRDPVKLCSTDTGPRGSGPSDGCDLCHANGPGAGGCHRPPHYPHRSRGPCVDAANGSAARLANRHDPADLDTDPKADTYGYADAQTCRDADTHSGGPPLPVCTIATDSALAPAWELAGLGCPTAASAVIWAAWEPFEHGAMFWRSDADWAYVLHWQNGTNASLGDWITGENGWKWDGSFPDGHGLMPPQGRLEPIRGFGYVWFSFLGGPTSAIGWATAAEKGFCVTLQPFANGVIFRSNSVPYCQDQLFNWASDPSFAPIFVTLYGDKSWQSW